MNLLLARRNLYVFFYGFLALLAVAGTARGQATARLPGIVKDQSGATVAAATVTPFTLYSKNTFDPANTSCLPSGSPISGNYWFDPTAFDCNVTGAPGSLASFGDLGRNTVRGPGINNWDISFLKRFQFTERMNLESRAELFNALNHAQFLSPDNNGFSGTFGQISQTRGPRLAQFGLKFYH